MTKTMLAAVAACLFVLGGEAQAAGFVCASTLAKDGAGLDAAQKALIPAGAALNDDANLNNAISALRQRGVRDADITDSLVAAYCPTVASDSALSDGQKTARVQRYALRLTRMIYAPPDAEEIFLDVALTPAVLQAVTAKAQAAGVTPETWVANLAAAAAK